jgi:hypothetical protein
VALGGTPFVASFPYRLTARDPSTLILATVVLAGVTVIAIPR